MFFLSSRRRRVSRCSCLALSASPRHRGVASLLVLPLGTSTPSTLWRPPRHRRNGPPTQSPRRPTPSTRRISRNGTRGTHGGGGGCAAKRSVTSTDVQALACFMCAATPLTCASRRCLLDLSRASDLRRCAEARRRRPARDTGQLHAIDATLEKGRRFADARRERALFNFVGVLDRRLGHADGLWVSGGGRRGEVDARGFVGGRRVGACERRVASMLYLSRLPRSGISLLHRGTASLYPTGTPSLRRSERTPCHARFARRIALAGASSSLFGVGASSASLAGGV